MRLTNRQLASLAVLFALALWGSIALTGCFEYSPLDSPTRAEVAGIDVAHHHAVPKERHAMLLFQGHVEAEYGVDLGNAWETASVEWVETDCAGDGNPGIFWYDKCHAGLMFTCNEMYVAGGPGENRVCGTALVHEFAHCLSYLMDGTYSGDHSADLFWLVWGTNREICGRGW